MDGSRRPEPGQTGSRPNGGGRDEAPGQASAGELVAGARRDLRAALTRVGDGQVKSELGRVVRALDACLEALRGEEPAAPGEAVSGAQPAAPAPTAARPSPRRRVRVLLVDDHELVREGLVGLLAEEPDIEVVGEASGGQVALEMVQQLRPDVVVMDVSMPDMNGIEATRRITTERPGVRVIGLSMHQEEDMAAAMREFGAAAYLTKDGSSDALLAAIRGGDPG